MDLVVISLERWDEVWRRNQHLVSGLLKTDPTLRALFVEPPDDPLHAVRSGSRPEFGGGVRAVSDRLWSIRPVKWLPRRIDPGFDDRLAAAVQRTAERLGMTRPVLWVNDPAAAGIARSTGWPTLYDITDDWLAADRPAAESERVARGEQWLLAHADAVVACSPELVRRKSAAREDITLIRNAVDVAAYQRPHARPTDLPAGAAAVYLGTLHRDRLDIGLCMQTADALGSKATVVLVGPNLLGVDDTRRLRESGVVVLGARPSSQVIGYLQHADVLLVPHVVTAFTESLDPIKLYEYQAVRKPIVSTPVAGFRDAEGVVVAEGAAFPAAVRSSMDNPTTHRERGRPPVDWGVRVSEMSEALKKLR